MLIRSDRRLRAIETACGSLLSLFLLGVSVSAEDLTYVTERGTSIPLERSTTEVGVILSRTAVSTAARSKLADRFVDVSSDSTCPIKILKLDAANGITRASALADPTIQEVHPIYRFATSSHPVMGTGTLVAKVRPGQTAADLNALFGQYGVNVVEAIEGLSNVYKLAPTGDPDACVECAARMAKDSRVIWSQPNFRSPVESHQVSPGDSFFSAAWHLHNTGQLGGKVGADIDALEAWSVADGQDIRFGMFDDSADIAHEDLREGYLGIGHDPSVPSNNRSDFEDPSPKSVGNNHGTRVLGLAVARANSLGARGVAYQAQWTASRGLNNFLTNAEQASVYTFAIQQNVDVHINSWGFLPGIPTPAVVSDAIRRAYSTGRNKGNIDSQEGDDPLGMIILFSSGNFGFENEDGKEVSTLPEVISVGAIGDDDVRASYSQFGDSLDVLAPSGGNSGTAGIFTTDNSDRTGAADVGANDGGFNVDIGIPEFDQTGNYTGYFSGTSASCPIAAGVAGLVLSANPLLTVPDVRMILTHTTDRVEPTDADYDGVTGHSLTYGYGRLNAKKAVDAAAQSLVNGGFTWPVAPAFVSVQDNQVRFFQNDGTNQYLVVTSESPFEFVPVDDECYDTTQIGCTSRTPAALPSGVTVHVVGCGLRCGLGPSDECRAGDEQCFDFTADRTRYFGIYGYSEVARYSFGVSVDTLGNVSGNEDLIRGVDVSGGIGGGGGGGGSLPSQGPAVTIMASPLEGDSPLIVQFTGNAVSAVAIDSARTQWDFDTSDGVLVDSNQRNTTHTYSVPAGETRNFVARLTMYDVNGNVGFEQVTIQVRGASTGTGGGPVGSTDLRIVASIPGSPGSDVTEGISPFELLITVSASEILGTVQSVVWDLGDGTRLTGLTVPHTYLNESETTIRLPVTATVTTRNSTGATATNTTTKLITVFPGLENVDPGTPNLPGTGVPGGAGGASPCGATGMIPLLGLVLSMGLLRRRHN